MRSSAWFALGLAAPLAFTASRAHADPPPDLPAGYISSPPLGYRDPAVGKETRSSAMVASGIVLISVATTMLPIGTIVWSASGQDCISSPMGTSFTCQPARERFSGLGILVAAAGGLAIGIPLLVLGAQKVPIEVPRRAALTIGPASAGLRVDF
jgi:hypothetical protein